MQENLFKKDLTKLNLIKDIFENLNINLLNKGNIKSEIWKKKLLFHLAYKKRVFRTNNDIIGFRIILENIDDCYKTLGLIHKE